MQVTTCCTILYDFRFILTHFNLFFPVLLFYKPLGLLLKAAVNACSVKHGTDVQKNCMTSTSLTEMNTTE